MHKFFRHTAVAALAAILAAGPSMTALAAQDDSNTGPAFDNTVSLEAPGSDATTGPGVSGPASEQGTGASSGSAQDSGAGQTGGSQADGSSQTADSAQTGGTEAAQGGQTHEAPPILTTENTNQAFFQIQLLKSDLTWTTPVTGDSTIQPGSDGFLSMSIYINNLPGDVLYRTYSSYTGWTEWAMNGGHTAWNLGFPV